MTPNTALMTVTKAAGQPTLEEAAEQLGVPPDRLNREFGVVPVDVSKGLYTVEMDADVAADRQVQTPYDGPYSNPQIEDFGPPEPDSHRK